MECHKAQPRVGTSHTLSHFILTITPRGASRFPFVLPMEKLRQGRVNVTFHRSPTLQEAVLAVNLGSLAPQPCSQPLYL